MIMGVINSSGELGKIDDFEKLMCNRLRIILLNYINRTYTQLCLIK